jgi:hypothetical protein
LIFWLNQKWVLAQDIMKLHMMIQHLLRNWCNRMKTLDMGCATILQS